MIHCGPKFTAHPSAAPSLGDGLLWKVISRDLRPIQMFVLPEGFCWICKKPIAVDEVLIDEFGFTCHKDCHREQSESQRAKVPVKESRP